MARARPSACNGDTGMPMIRAMLFEEDSDYAASTATQYQYMFGLSPQ